MRKFTFLNKHLRAILPYLIYFLCLIPIGVFSVKKPAYNWDMLAYMALVIRVEQRDINQIHAMTYDNAKQNIPAEAYVMLTGNPSSYRRRMAENAIDFYGNLPFYTIKPLYTGLTYLFYKIGFSLPFSTVLPSILAYMLIGLLLFHWLKKYIKVFFALAAGLFLMYSIEIVNLGRTSTPDCLSGLLLLAAFYFILEKRSLLFAFPFLVVSVFCRLDNIINSCFILYFLTVTDKWEKKISFKQLILMLGILFGCYFTITYTTARDFGWNILYYPKLIQYFDVSYQFQHSFSLKKYLELAYSHAFTALLSSNLVLFLFIVLLLLINPLPVRFNQFNLEQLFCLILVLIIVIRYVLYPNLDDRFYIAFYLTILVLLVKKIAGFNLIEGRKQTT